MTPRAPVPHLTHPSQLRQPRTRLGRAAERLLSPIFAVVSVIGVVAMLAASSFLMAAPGVTVMTGATPGATQQVRVASGTYFAVGLTERGDTTAPIEIRSMAEYAEKCGDRPTYGSLYDNLATAFAEGLRRAYIVRVVGAAATVGTLTLKDRSAGAGLNTLRIDAKNAGGWSSQVSIAITDGNVTNTFTVTVYLNGDAAEVYRDIASPGDAATVINQRSTLITATNLGSASTAPSNNPRTDLGGGAGSAAALSAGSDDRAAVDTAALVGALAKFTPGYGTGAVAIPGQAASTVGTGIIAHCRTHRRTPLLAPAAATSVSSAKAEALALRSLSGAENAGYFYPHVQIPDGAGGVRTIDPTGFVAGVRARTHELEGPHRAPAGEISAARFVVGLERELTQADIESLTEGRVNPIRTVAGSVRLYGWRSLSLDTANYVMLTGAEVLNAVAAEAERRLERFVFSTIDPRGHLFAEVESEIKAILEPIRAAGGLWAKTDPTSGEEIDPGYVIDTGPSVNTDATLAANELRVRVGLRVSPTAELIYLTVTKVAQSATF